MLESSFQNHIVDTVMMNMSRSKELQENVDTDPNVGSS